jgi:hypothetical protein
VVALVVLAGCAHSPQGPGFQAAAHATTRIEITHLPDRDAWRVSYFFAERSDRFVFGRPTPKFRAETWKVTFPAGARVEDVGDVATLASPQPVRHLEVEIEGKGSTLEQELQPFIPFTDGGVLLFTGYFPAFPVGCSTHCSPKELHALAQQRATAPIIFVPRPHEKLVLEGQVWTGPHEWTGEKATLAYFGGTAPVESADLVLVVDKGFPDWLRQEAERVLPQAFAYFTRRTGEALEHKPTIFLSYGEAPGVDEIQVDGSTRPRIVQLGFHLGPNRRAPGDAMSRETLVSMVLHEAAHMWNAQLYTHVDEGGAWLPEGAADAFMLRAVEGLGLLGSESIHKLLTEKAGRCAATLRNNAMAHAKKSGQHQRAFQDCGLMVALAAQGELRRVTPTADIIDVWKDVFKAARETPKHAYTETLFFDVLGQKLGKEAAGRVRRLVTESYPQDPETHLVDYLKASGVNARVDATVAASTASAPRRVIIDD